MAFQINSLPVCISKISGDRDAESSGIQVRKGRIDPSGTESVGATQKYIFTGDHCR